MESAEYVEVPDDAGALILKQSRRLFGSVDAVLFDCDGVLIDTRESYDRAIVKTIEFLFSRLLNVEIGEGLVGRENIYLLRSTGGFNNDTDTAYILSLWIFAGLDRATADLMLDLDGEPKTGENPRDLLTRLSNRVSQRSGYLKRVTDISPPPLERVVALAMKSTRRQVLSVEDLARVMGEIAEEAGLKDSFEAFERAIGKPGRYGEGLLETVFSDLYYGPENVRRIFGRGPYFDLGPGLYLNEKINIRRETLERLSEMLGQRLGIVSGRDRISTEIVLGDLMRFFNRNACVFLADEQRRVGEVVKKPSPYGIVKAVEGAGGSSCSLYAGNSAEDLFMARGAERYGVKTLFMAVYGLAPDRERARDFFLSLRSDAIVSSPDSVLRVLEVFR
jgi:phosphoglycolate phosphatase-like HAD superfamily hydrolase